ncbi:MAG: S-methyl-5'-thioinosine phosphorylase [Anaerolineales bacterium]|nr:S-methyl-5'-thioinosine phosphorylase [Anaerolineales bacterium]
MPVGIIAGTAIYDIPSVDMEESKIDTPYGEALILHGTGEDSDLVFIPRHGPKHTIPPHNVNYRANLKALDILGVRYVLAAYAVGSINREIPPLSLVAIDDFLDFTSGRESTFFDGTDDQVVHIDVSQPFCQELRVKLLDLAAEHNLAIVPKGTYVAANGPRLESPAEIRMFEKLGADVVGMTACPECILAKELEMCFAAVAFSVNWAAGIEEKIHFVEDGLNELTASLLALFIKTLREVAA